MSNLAAASVALIVLIDLATGQGPPILNSYREAMANSRLPPPAIALQPVNPPYPGLPRGDYGPGPEGPSSYAEGYPKDKGEYKSKSELKDYDKKDKEIESGKEKEAKGYDNAYKGTEKYEKSTPAPGVFSTFSNSMSDAWNSLTTLGRSKRSSRQDAVDEKPIEPKVTGHIHSGAARSAFKGSAGSSAGRSIESLELMQLNNQGYIYFKVPRHLVCYS